MQLSKPALHILTHPLSFALHTIRGFNKNQGMLMAGAVAYYSLLSVLPLLILSVIALSHFVSQEQLLITLGQYLEWVVPSQSKAVLDDVSAFLKNGIAIGSVLLVTMMFFSSLAFSVLEKAMSVIFPHRGVVEKRHYLVSAVLPYCFALLLCISMLGLTIATIILQAMAQESFHFMGYDWSLRGVSGVLLYVFGFTVEALILSTLYMVLPVGPMRLHHALIGGFVTTGLWEILRHILFWYFSTLSKASIVYGSLTTAVVALFSMEIAAMLLLFGAQVISEYERLERE